MLRRTTSQPAPIIPPIAPLAAFARRPANNRVASRLNPSMGYRSGPFAGSQGNGTHSPGLANSQLGFKRIIFPVEERVSLPTYAPLLLSYLAENPMPSQRGPLHLADSVEVSAIVASSAL